MAILEDVKRALAEGKSEREIIDTFQKRGNSLDSVVEALTQAKIRNAVAGTEEAPSPGQTIQGAEAPMIQEEAVEGQMVQSLGAQTEEAAPPAEEAPIEAPPVEAPPVEAPSPTAEYPPEETYAQAPQAAYPEAYAPQYAPGASPEIISEIAEQVFAEKLSPIRERLEKAIDLKTKLDARMDAIDERLKRIEGIIDRIQLSVLQKVGDYMTNVEDIKKELVETQKSFKALSPSSSSKKPQLQ